jgi:hypothetical protein
VKTSPPLWQPKHLKIGAGALQGHIRADDINNVIGRADLLQGRGRKQAGHGSKIRMPNAECRKKPEWQQSETKLQVYPLLGFRGSFGIRHSGFGLFVTAFEILFA